MSSDIGSQNAPMRARILRLGWWAKLIALMAGVAILLVLAPSLYYERSQGSACANCHEIWQPYAAWHASAHRDVPCSGCHGSVFTLDAAFHINNAKRLYAHLRGDSSTKPRLNRKNVLAILARCQSCHQHEFAEWRSSRHSATYADIFLNSEQNHRQKLMDDCLRCHAMHFQGSIRDLVAPLDTRGPWQLLQPQLAKQPAIPCLACHQIHRAETPEQPRSESPIAAPQQEINWSTLALFDRRELDHVPVGDLPMPEMLEDTRRVEISHDQRQALCYQCHAPLANRQVRSGDDRTPVGVHEGLSCFACHSTHEQQTRVSCATCHLQISVCGLSVENMDTTFRDGKSRHNIHSVKCIDCHSKGVPGRKQSGQGSHPVAKKTTA